MKILVTGVAGFIGFHLTKKLLDNGHTVLGVDNLNKYYEIKLKKDRLNFLKRYKKRFLFFKGDIARQEFLNKFKKKKFSIIINLAAQAGVRYSIKNPYEYAKSNLVGFVNVIELAKIKKIKHFIYASSSSVYGYSKKKYYKEDDPVDHPMQLYAATKRSNELIAHAYSSLFDLPVTGLRFFTVYGPWGRPDMSIFMFVKNILKRKKIQIFNFGNHERSFTYIDDIVEGIISLIDKIPKKRIIDNKKKLSPANSYAPFRILNLGSDKSVKLMTLINKIENLLNIKSKKKFLKIQQGDIKTTKANINKIKKINKNFGKIKINEGLEKFIDWFKDYYKIKN
jgi:UDP-glucuronate 4-epimerase